MAELQGFICGVQPFLAFSGLLSQPFFQSGDKAGKLRKSGDKEDNYFISLPFESDLSIPVVYHSAYCWEWEGADHNDCRRCSKSSPHRERSTIPCRALSQKKDRLH